MSLTGAIHLSRPYYHCTHCEAGIWPWDEILCLSPERLTPGAQEVTTLAGIVNSFGNAADRVLEKMAGLNVSESTVERTTEAAGERLGARLDAGETFGATIDWKWNRDAEGKTCAYVSIDATGVMMQGPQGAKTEGRMVNVGMIFNPRPRTEKEQEICKPCDGARYLAGLYELHELGPLLRRQGGQVGMNRAEVWIALTDAGNGLEAFMKSNFPQAIRIVDFRHAAEYVHGFAKAYRPGSDAETLAETWCHQLKHEGGASLLATLQGLDRESMSAGARQAYDEALSYFGNHHERMNYPTYLKRGWQIGTGAMESACKRVINQRLNMGGMRWGVAGCNAVSHLRGLYCSDADQWDGFWSNPHPHNTQVQMAA